MPEVTKEDIKRIQSLGYTVTGIDSASLSKFVNDNYMNFDLLRFVEETEGFLRPLTNRTRIRTIDVERQDTANLTVEYITDNHLDENERLLFSRTFKKSDNGISVNHNFLVFPKDRRGQGLGKKILEICLKHYLQIGVNKINVFAGLEDGGYLWARVGFHAIKKREMEIILKDAEGTLQADEFMFVKKIYDHYYEQHATGENFPIQDWAGLPPMKAVLNRNNWHGQLDLKNPDDLANFKRYVTG